MVAVGDLDIIVDLLACRPIENREDAWNPIAQAILDIR